MIFYFSCPPKHSIASNHPVWHEPNYLLDLLGLDGLYLAKRLRSEFWFHIFFGLHGEVAGGLGWSSIVFEDANVFAAVRHSRVQHLEGDEPELASRVHTGACRQKDEKTVWLHRFLIIGSWQGDSQTAYPRPWEISGNTKFGGKKSFGRVLDVQKRPWKAWGPFSGSALQSALGRKKSKKIKNRSSARSQEIV